MLRQYETTFIVNVHLEGEQIDATIDKYTKYIEKNGGKVKSIDRWGKHRLAYEIAKKQYGYYVYIRFEAAGSIIRELERELKLDDSILRYLTVLVPKAVLNQELKQESTKTETKAKETIENEEPSSEQSHVLDTSVHEPEDINKGISNNSEVE